MPSFIALTPNLLLMSHDEPLVRRAAVAVTSATPPPGLAALPRFHTARASMPPQLFAFGYMNLQGIDWTKAFERGAARAARNASDLSRPLMAVPGPVTSAMSAGCHSLIREGRAVCVTSAADIVTHISPVLR